MSRECGFTLPLSLIFYSFTHDVSSLAHPPNVLTVQRTKPLSDKDSARREMTVSSHVFEDLCFVMRTHTNAVEMFLFVFVFV